MAQTRRMGVESSPRRAMFIDAAEEILRSVGYVGISARQVAAQAGLKTQLLYYYFLTMDDLILAVVRRINERRLQRLDEALASPEPLRALRSEEHTSELQSLMRISYAVFCLKKNTHKISLTHPY